MTSGKRTPDETRLAIQRLASQKDADGRWLLSCEEIARRVQVSRGIVFREIREAARQWWHVSRWRDDHI